MKSDLFPKIVSHHGSLNDDHPPFTLLNLQMPYNPFLIDLVSL